MLSTCIVMLSHFLSRQEVTKPEPSCFFHIAVFLLTFLYSIVKEKNDALRKHFAVSNHTKGNNIFRVTGKSKEE